MNAALAAGRPAALDVRGLERRYGAVVAARAVDFSVAAGRILCLLGSSGCGKSTVLRLIAGLEVPDAGTVAVDGQLLSGPGSFVAPEKRGVGLVFQDYALFPHLSVLDNVAFGLRGSRGERIATARKALARVQLEARASGFPHMLSGGEQQRVALARALAPRPRLLLMDEPFSNLDRGLRESVRDETLALLREAGITVVLVTHDPEEALRVADHIVLMRAGQVEQQGTPEDIYRHPASLYAARFFSQLVEVRGRCTSGHVTTPLGDFAAPGVSEGMNVCVALRPHDLQPAGAGVEARVLESTFLGPVQQLRLAVAGVDQPLALQVTGPCVVRTGEAIHIRATGTPCIFPDSQGSTRSNT